MMIRHSERKFVRCWNCRHLKMVYRGEPKGGKLFGEMVQRCDVVDLEFDKYFQIVKKRECKYHGKCGLWETPPNV